MAEWVECPTTKLSGCEAVRLDAVLGTAERETVKYQVNGTMVVSCWCVVEADSPEEARRLASKLEPADHHIDGSFPSDEAWHFDNDGTPDISSVESA